MEEFLCQLRWTGRFGNRMFQYAYGSTYARITGLPYWIPSPWEGSRLFAAQDHHLIEEPGLRALFDRPDDGSVAANVMRWQALRRHHPDLALFDAELAAEPYATPGHPLCHGNGCAYNPAIFAGMSRAHLRQVFEFSDEVKRLDVYRRCADMQGLYDVAHLRRDDISNVEFNRTHVQGYSVIGMDAYRRAFREHGHDEREIHWVSDDYTGQWHVGRRQRQRGGWAYPQGSETLPGVLFDWLADFLTLYFARTIYRANSSFSWWAAMLSPTARVFSPVIDRKFIYGVDGIAEIDVDFVEGNQPHYLYGGDGRRMEILIGP